MNLDNTSIYIFQTVQGTVVGRYERDSQVHGEVTIRQCLVITPDSLSFFDALNIQKPDREQVCEFDQSNREGLAILIAQHNPRECPEPLKRFLRYYDGVQYISGLRTLVEQKSGMNLS